MTQHCLVQLGRLPTFMTCGPCPSINPGPHNSPARPCHAPKRTQYAYAYGYVTPGRPWLTVLHVSNELPTPHPSPKSQVLTLVQTARGICICSCEVLSFTVNIYFLPAIFQTTIFSFSVRAHFVSRESLPGINPT
jgi:hypothetical protein